MQLSNDYMKDEIAEKSLCQELCTLALQAATSLSQALLRV
ncbi:hypothetical protein BV360_03045 [Pseudomonas syringae pv. actinidiae]|uniref:Uncharacterized protein n=4 Tax=Pseudomonas syringae group TaxID=136849 RepID=A0A2V0R4D4_PSESF|nr:hypothetical protein AN901_200333 [Pseudomonas syringae pv. theae]OSN17537.1 hypothetical protein BV340_02949 [Pseudomonas syringae pv. actinidiae]RML51269.1 hypothetical protein ALQ94_03419 [Pseudomonas amygdali pv. morsprunorum]SOS35391.1 hypothetical protein CFBP6411_04034 [Pseudomonas syringae group genomosp. 3]OSN19298.1 hypothetical protein BV339_02813 [Pseudomonas syringae pv. actinidiae]